MSIFSKKFVAILTGTLMLCGAAHAVSYNMYASSPTARPSVAAAARMPSINYGTGSSSSSSSSSSTTLTQSELIELYLECLRGSDACGTNFEECTTKTLFYGKKSQCAGQLLLMPTAAITTLYGNGTIANHATRSTTERDENGDWAFVYPTNGSMLGSMIEGAVANNRLSTQDCVRNYQRCLTKDDVCGADFELCTTDREFKKQKVFCASILARCGDEGKTELYGSTNTTGNPSTDSRLGILIEEGRNLAAVNAVATCYKVADTCILNACSGNPYKCKEGTDQAKVCAASEVITPETGDPYCADGSPIQNVAVNRNTISGLVKNECLDTIGANRYCFTTVFERAPKTGELQDPDMQNDVYSSLFGSRFNDGMRSKIDALIDRFDRSTRNKCQETIVNCAMSACGGGSGAACYASAFGNNGSGVTSNASKSEIKYGCEHIVNNDRSCQYVAADFIGTTGSWDWADNSVFDVLFTAADDIDAKKPDATGAVAELNSKLSLSYSQAALDQMRAQCQSTASACVKSMCGTDYTNCYRNRTDITSSIASMPGTNAKANQAGGVLDSSIVIGLCINTVKNNPICAEHLRAEVARGQAAQATTTLWGGGNKMWGNNQVANAWIAGGDTSYGTSQAQVQASDDDGNLLCLASEGNTADYGRCDDPSGRYTVAYMVTYDMYYTIRAENQIFASVLRDMELEAQAIYKAKLTRQQNMCLSENAAGGIMGNRDLGGTFMWAKLTSAKVPNNYGTNGLASRQFTASNDLYGSFCRIKIDVKSDDDMLTAAFSGNGKAYVHGKEVNVPDLSSYASTYFAAGDAFTCGSWIPSNKLGEISQKIADARYNSNANSRTRNWITLAGTVLGGTGGYVGTNALQKNTGLGGLLGTYRDEDQGGINLSSEQRKELTNAKTCSDSLKSASSQLTTAQRTANRTKSTPAGAMSDATSINGNISSATSYISTANTAAESGKVAGYTKVEIPAGLTASADGYSVTVAGLDTLIASVNSAQKVCNDRYSELNKNVEIDNQNKRYGVNWVGAAVGGTLGGVLAYQATKSVQKANAEGEAAQWYEDVGNHIKCYIGAQEVGSYGDVISTEMD